MKKIKKILFLAFAFSLVNGAEVQGGVTIPSNTGLPSGTLAGVIQNFTMWLLGIFGFLAIIGFIVSGIMYLTASGNEDQQKKAKRQMYWSITGVIIGLMGYVIIKAVDAWLKGGTTF